MSEARGARIDLQPACLLHRRPYRETSLLLEIFSRDHGRVPLVARGARRTRRGAGVDLQPFHVLLLGWSMRGELGNLNSSEPMTDGPQPVLGGEALASGFYVNELVMRLLHRFDPHPVLFDTYVATLHGVAAPARREAALRVFEKRLLEEIGYGMVLTHDAQTGEPVRAEKRYVFHVDRGPCADDRAESSDAAVPVGGATLLDLAGERLQDPASLAEAKRLMRRVVDHHLGGRPLQSRALFRARGPG